MPASIVKSFADKTGKSVQEVEKLWDEAKILAKKEGQPENFAYITGILKKMLEINEETVSGDIAPVTKKLLFIKRYTFKDYIKANYKFKY